MTMQFEENNKAIYLQIAERICDEIVEGKYGDDSRLPSVREYAALAEVNANTVMRSYERLASDNIIYNRRGIGFFVTPGAKVKIIKRRSDDLVDLRLDSFFKLLHSLDVSPEDLAKAYSNWISNQK